MIQYLLSKKEEKAKEKIHKIWYEYLENKTEKDYLSIYINIPFCTQKCKYCEYSSKVKPYGVSDNYLDYLEKQFKEASNIFKNEPIKNVMFGGGSPSILTARQLKETLDLVEDYWNLEIDDDNEMGFEFHPAQITDKHIEVLRDSFINRFSMGVQTFDSRILKTENRIPVTKERVEYIYNNTKDFIKITNVDLLGGLIGQTSEILLDDVGTLLDMGIESLTIYELNAVNGRNNKERKRKYLTNMLIDVYNSYGQHPDYDYIGTTNNSFMHCNRFYKKVNNFYYPYNPSPLGYNNVLSFNLDNKNLQRYVWSFFTPLNIAYEHINNDYILFYKMTLRPDRPGWRMAVKNR